MRAALIDPNGRVANVVVVGDGYTSPDGFTLVPSDTAGLGDSYADGAFTSPPGPPPPPPPAPTATGNQWAFALSDLGLAGAWLAGKAKSKASDQFRVDLIARDTPLVASDPLLIRVAGNAGQDGSGKPLIDVPTVFVHAQTMPL